MSDDVLFRNRVSSHNNKDLSFLVFVEQTHFLADTGSYWYDFTFSATISPNFTFDLDKTVSEQVLHDRGPHTTIPRKSR